MPKLKNHKHELFAQALARGLSRSDAYRAAGYKAKPEAVRSAAGRLFTNVDVQDRLDELLERGAYRAEVTQERVLRELAAVAFANLSDFIDISDEGVPNVDMSMVTRELTSAISEITVDRIAQGEDEPDVERVRLKLHPKLPALTKLGEHLGMFGKDEAAKDGTVHFHFSGEPMSQDEWAKRFGARTAGESDQGEG